MDQEFYEGQAQRARDLAEKADKFTRKRLLALAETYDAKAGNPSIERPVPLPRQWPVSNHGRSGEA